MFVPANMQEYVNLVRNTNVGDVSYDLSKFELERVVSENMEIYLKNQRTVEKKQPAVY
jgi:hypothetical protein